jgi:cysteinyl-tRNA synthetase
MTALRLYNTLTRTKEDFVPIDKNNVRMYVCGPTVYDYAHIGNARPAIVFDVLFRLLRHTYGPDHVTYVRNITDIDDKINARALERRGDRNVPILDVVRELTEETYGVYRDDVTALGCLPPSAMPRATENIAPMIAMTKTLIDNGHAYEAAGHVLFDVSSKPDYGKLSRRSTDDMIAGARVDVAPYKKNPMDFVLWKPSDANTPGWDSPWGRGRPGWHLECSAMIQSTFKGTDTIDIHGGGIDLVFPHHENEIAQSESAHHEHPLAKVWMHNGFLNVEGEKMSKSLGNFVTINEILERWAGTSLRMAMLMTHYRQPIDWTEKRLAEVDEELRSWVQFGIENEEKLAFIRHRLSQGEIPKVSDKLLTALHDDLNTPEAMMVLRELFDKTKRGGDFEAFYGSAIFLGVIDPSVSGAYWTGVGAVTQTGKGADWLFQRYDLVQSLKLALINYQGSKIDKLIAEIRATGADVDIADWDKHVTLEDDVTEKAIEEIEAKIAARLAARKAKDFKESDRIRDELAAQGIILKDGPQGTTWEVKK